jgi:hypothetical protein
LLKTKFEHISLEVHIEKNEAETLVVQDSSNIGINIEVAAQRHITGCGGS